MESESSQLNDTTNENSLIVEESELIQTQIPEPQPQTSKSNVIQTRILNELKQLDSSGIQHKYDSQQKIIFVSDKIANIRLDLSNAFPFDSPRILIELKNSSDYFSLFDFSQVSFEQIMKEHWHPSIKLQDIIEKTSDFVIRNITNVSEVPNNVSKIIHNVAQRNNIPIYNIFLGILIIRMVCVWAITGVDSLQGQYCHGIKHQIEYIKNLNQTVEQYYKGEFIESPLTLLTLKGLRIVLEFEQSNFAQAIILRSIASIVELIFVFIPIALLINSIYQPFGRSFRLQVISLVAFNPVIFMMTIVNAQIPETLFLGLLIFSLWLLLESQFEFSAAFFALSLGMNQLTIWFVPLFWVFLLYKLFREQLISGAGGNLNAFDFTQLNAMFNRLSTIIMIFLVFTLASWAQVIISTEGVDLFLSAGSRLYLENYKKINQIYAISGNIWNILAMIKNGNLISLILFGICNMISLISIQTLNKKKFIKSILLITLSVLLFGIVYMRLTVILTLVIILMGVLFTEFQIFFASISLIFTLSYVSQDKNESNTHILILIYQILYQHFTIQFFNTLNYLIKKSKSKKISQTDEEHNKRQKGIINQYFRVQGGVNMFQVNKDSGFYQTLSKMNVYINLLVFALFIVVQLTSFWRDYDRIVNGIIFGLNLLVYVQILTSELGGKKNQQQVQQTQQTCSCQHHGHGHSHEQSQGTHQHRHDNNDNIELVSLQKAKES